MVKEQPLPDHRGSVKRQLKFLNLLSNGSTCPFSLLSFDHFRYFTQMSLFSLNFFSTYVFALLFSTENEAEIT